VSVALEKLGEAGVLITGGADGIGLALARALRASGARVFLTDVAADKLAANARAIGAGHAVCDVTDAEALAQVVDRAWREIGPLDLLCANAGVVAQGSLLSARREELDWIFEVNVWGILHAVRPYVARLRATRRAGHILMTGSETSLSYPGFTRGVPIHAYLMTKHCVLAMADALRVELAPEEIGVSVLCPGPVDTALGENSGRARPARFGGPASAGASALDPGIARSMSDLRRSPDQVAAVALAGLRRDLFVIPTHPHIRADAAERFREIERGFEELA
jgi:NAD(P)-dependent dehydrogenase (short-subunit alcohol dehydrogenase family)